MFRITRDNLSVLINRKTHNEFAEILIVNRAYLADFSSVFEFFSSVKAIKFYCSSLSFIYNLQIYNFL